MCSVAGKIRRQHWAPRMSHNEGSKVGARMLCAPSDGNEVEMGVRFPSFRDQREARLFRRMSDSESARRSSPSSRSHSGAGGRIEHVTVEALIGLVAPEHDRLDGDAKVARIAPNEFGDLNSLCSHAMVISRDAGAGMRRNRQSAMVRFHGGSLLAG